MQLALLTLTLRVVQAVTTLYYNIPLLQDPPGTATGTGSCPPSVLSDDSTKFRGWAVANLGPAAIIIIFAGLLFTLLGGFRTSWGQIGVRMISRPLLVILAIVFFPLGYALFSSLVAVFGGQDIKCLLPPQ